MPEHLQYRAVTLELDERGESASFDVPATLSTTAPVDRGGYVEVLDHSPGAISFAQDPLPLVVGHDARDTPIGRVSRLHADGKRLRGVVTFSRSQRAQEILQDVRDQMPVGISIGYTVQDWQRGDGRTQIATAWTLHEVSALAVPADPAAGFNRGMIMTTQTQEPRAELSGAAADAARTERQRCQELRALGGRHNLGALADEHIDKGTPVDVFRGIVLNEIDKRGGSKPLHTPVAEIGATRGDIENFSLSRLILAKIDPTQHARHAGLELEMVRAATDEVQRTIGREPKGVYLPAEVQRSLLSLQTRTNTVGGSGGNVVQTSVLASEYVPPAYNQPAVVQAGARVLTGLRDVIKIPKMSTGSTPGWVATENATLSQTDPAFAQVSLSPKDIGVYTDVSRRLMLQSNPAIDGLIRDDLAAQIQVALDAGAINGSGSSGQPTGVMNASGVGVAAVGTNGGAWTWPLVTTNVQNVFVANRGVGSLGWVVSGQARMHAARTQKVSGYPAYLTDGPDYSQLAGYPMFQTQNVPSNLTKGTGTNLTAAIFGNWNDLIIGEWGVMDLLLDPYTFSNTGAVRIRVIMTADVAVRFGAAFSMTNDINPT
jgi:HK97 family phage major capsid protein/HK97 family phage prohead protease